MQEKLYADGRWSVLIVLQAMDAAGKDSLIEHVMSGVNPQGVEVHVVQAAERGRTAARFPLAHRAGAAGAGRIGIFNRSHYEEVLTVARASGISGGAESAARQSSGKKLWQQRFKDIRAFEHHLARNGTLILKFFLNVSREEQRKRFLDAHRGAGQALEILDGRRRRAQALAEIHGGL